MEDTLNNKANEYLRHALQEIKTLGGEFPQTLEGFYKFHGAAMKDGVISRKNKELIATGIAMLVCTGECAKYHAAEAIHYGATRSEIMEAISVGMMMGGGPGVFHALELMRSLREIGIDLQFSNATEK